MFEVSKYLNTDSKSEGDGMDFMPLDIESNIVKLRSVTVVRSDVVRQSPLLLLWNNLKRPYVFAPKYNACNEQLRTQARERSIARRRLVFETKLNQTIHLLCQRRKPRGSSLHGLNGEIRRHLPRTI
jgi:hypothetical protein